MTRTGHQLASIRAALASDDSLHERLKRLFLAFAQLANDDADSFIVHMSALYGVNRAFKTEATKLLRDYIAVIALTLEESRMRGLVEGTTMIEEKIQQGMRLAGRPLREAHLPPESLVVSIRRKDELLFPRGSVVIEPGDVVTFLVSPTGEERLQKYLAEREKNLVEAC